MMYIKTILAAAFSVMAVTGTAQQKAIPVKGRWVTVEMGYGRQQQERIEFGLGRRRIVRWYPANDTTKNHYATLGWGPQCNLTGFINSNNVFRVGQKLSFAAEYNNVRHSFALGFKACVAVEHYTKKDIRLAFEGGPLLTGVLHLSYGYSVPVGKYTFPDIQRHRLGIVLFINSLGLTEAFERLLDRRSFNGV